MNVTKDEYYNVINHASGRTRFEEISLSYAIGGKLPSDNSPSYKQAVMEYRRNKRTAAQGTFCNKKASSKDALQFVDKIKKEPYTLSKIN